MTDTQTTQPTVADFANVISYGSSLTFSPDGRLLAYTSNADGQFNLWVQPVEGGEPRQLTFFQDQAVRQIAWSPDGTQILYTADNQGDEQYQIYLIQAEGGEPQAITSGGRVQYYLASEGAWSADGRYIAFAGNDREPTAQDIIVREIPTGEDDRPLADGHIYDPAAWSPDGTYLSGAQVRSNTDTTMLVVEVMTGTVRRLFEDEDPALYAPGPWAADGSGFWFLTDTGQEFLGLAFYDLRRDEMRWVAQPEWNVEAVAASQNGRYLGWVVNENGYSRVVIRDLTTGDDVPLPDLPKGTIKPWSGGLWFSPDSRTVALFMESPIRSTEIYAIDLESTTLTQLTDSVRADLGGVEMVEPELVHITAFDDRQIPAWLYRPHGEEPFPIVISIHGGPEAQERPTYAYRGLYQYLLSRGIGVLAPNIRGSSGYGKTYQKLIHRDLGGNDLKDFQSVADYAKSIDWVDPDRLGVFGGSYGGFAVLTCVSRLPDYWAAAVDIVGPSNLVTMLRSFPPTWKETAKATFGDVDTEEEDLLRRSPITYADQIVAPLFIIQGANDPRVVKAESDQIVEKLRARDVPVRYDVYEDEGHGFTKKENELKALGDTAAFFEEHLLGAEASSGA